MSKIAILGFPAYGHTNPLIKLIKNLISKGNEVYCFSFNDFKEKIESAGAKFISYEKMLQKDIRPKDTSEIGSDLKSSIRSLVDLTLELEEPTKEKVLNFDPNIIIADSMAVWGKKISQDLNKPFITSITTFAINNEVGKTSNGNLLDLFKLLSSFPGVNRETKRLKKRGYKIRSFMDLIRADENYPAIIYTSREFQPKSSSLPENFYFIGPSIEEPNESFKKNRDKLIYVSLGTVNNNNLDFYKAVINSFKDLDNIQVIISTGKGINPNIFGKLPSNISIYEFVDQPKVLKSADLFITHGGMNSASEGIFFKTPLLFYPQTDEQKIVANRAKELKLGDILNSLDSSSIRDYAQKLIDNSDTKENLAQVKESFDKSNQLDINDLVEDVITNFK